MRAFQGSNAFHWPISGQVIIAAVGLITATVLARILGPDTFGVYFVALAVSSSVGIVADLCVGQAILTRAAGYRARAFEWRRLASVLALIAAVGILAVVLPLSQTGDQRAMWILLCAALPLTAASMIPRAFLVLEGRLRAVAIADVTSVMCASCASIAWVFISPTPVAAAIGPFLIAIVRLAALEALSRRIRPAHEVRTILGWRRSWRELAAHVSGIYATQLAGFTSRNGDNLVVSALLGPADLAFYSRAFSFLVGPLQQAQMALNSMMLRDASDARANGNSLGHLSGLTLLMFALMLPMSATIGAIGPQIVGLVLGDEWSLAGDIMTLSAGLAVSLTVSLPARWTLLAAGDNAVLRKVSVLQLSLLAGCAIGSLVWGVQGAMAANALVVGPLIAIAEWNLLPRECRRFFWKRALPLALSLALVPFLLASAVTLLPVGNLGTVVSALLIGGSTSGIALGFIRRSERR